MKNILNRIIIVILRLVLGKYYIIYYNILMLGRDLNERKNV